MFVQNGVDRLSGPSAIPNVSCHFRILPEVFLRVLHQEQNPFLGWWENSVPEAEEVQFDVAL